MLKNKDRRLQWITDVLKSTPNLTFTLYRPLGYRQVFTANPLNVQHILKKKFPVYPKGDYSRRNLGDFLGDGIFNANGESWKFQRQMASHEFNTRSLKKFVETVVDTELSDRLIPVLASAAKNKTVLDFQDILQRFTFDNICKIAFGYDPGYLLPSFQEAKFAVAFEEAVRISSQRFHAVSPLVWKLKRRFNIGSERKLRAAVEVVQEFAKKIVREKKKELEEKSTLESVDLLSRFLSSGHSDENFVMEIVISFILAGRDTTSAALTWFFWLVFRHPEVENQILKEVRSKSESTVYDEVKNMVYTHAALSETMRLYPPVPVDSKAAAEDDVLPDGTVVKKGWRVTYHPYAMGRVEDIWGKDWPEFRPERWLERDGAGDSGNWSFVGRDSYVYPVFQAGPRICLGKEMAFMQMKRVVAGVLRRFRVVPVVADKDVEQVFITYLTSKMKGGFPVTIEERSAVADE
nr:cytochrome P450 94A2-like [Ipomoea batatas]